MIVECEAADIDEVDERIGISDMEFQMSEVTPLYCSPSTPLLAFWYDVSRVLRDIAKRGLLDLTLWVCTCKVHVDTGSLPVKVGEAWWLECHHGDAKVFIGIIPHPDKDAVVEWAHAVNTQYGAPQSARWKANEKSRVVVAATSEAALHRLGVAVALVRDDEPLR